LGKVTFKLADPSSEKHGRGGEREKGRKKRGEEVSIAQSILGKKWEVATIKVGEKKVREKK